MSSEFAIKVEKLSKCYQIYDQPRDRLRQFVLPRIQRGIGLSVKQYYREFWALQDISIEIKKGETVGILGVNGSGKSTLLQIVAGTLTPTSGMVTTHGRIAALLELGSGFNLEFTGRENVYLNGALLGLTKTQINERFDTIAAFADIGDHLDLPVKTYSSGMYVRLAFAVQACIEPDVLIVDEALSVGDEKFQRKCFDYLDKLRSQGCCILLVTHSTATVEKFCQRGILLHKGVVHGIGPAKEIVDRYHALLYSDGETYARYLEQNKTVEGLSASTDQANMQPRPIDSMNGDKKSDSAGMRAVIAGWEVLDAQGNPSVLFKTGETIKVSFFVDVFSQIDEIQAGILIRTVEGVSAFGTSTLYHQKNFVHAQPGNRLRFDFELQANLCTGSYFITLAIAEAVSHDDMLYLDRKTDVIVVKLYQLRVLANGIAMLDANITVSEVGACA